MSIGSDSLRIRLCYILTNDIVFDPNNNPEHVFNTALIASGTKFRGRFDGNGYRIVNLKIEGQDNVGLFATVSFADYFPDAGIYNLILENVSISGADNVGAICGVIDEWGTLDNCTVSGTVSGNYVGGVCGYNNYGTITNSFSSCTVNGGLHVGGFCGSIKNGTVKNCSTDCTVTGMQYVGGFCGSNRSDKIFLNSSAGTVITESSNRVGGFCGYNYSYNDGTIRYGIIRSCYTTAAVSGQGRFGNWWILWMQYRQDQHLLCKRSCGNNGWIRSWPGFAVGMAIGIIA